jgi:hypothetical protein
VLGLHPRGIYDFLDTLVALDFLERDGDGPDGKYRNTLSTAQFLSFDLPEVEPIAQRWIARDSLATVPAAPPSPTSKYTR